MTSHYVGACIKCRRVLFYPADEIIIAKEGIECEECAMKEDENV
jgi:DNA-directed RNA polymerase subunit RPC12/RpoP